MVYISALILRKRFMKESPEIYEGRFKIPGGYGFLIVICVIPMIVAVGSFLINGTDYFIGGMIGIISGPVMYFIWKNIYGGLHKKNPEENKLNTKTNLAPRDMYRLALMFILLAAIGVLGSLWLPFFEATEGWEWTFPDDYDMTIFGSQGAMWFAIKVASAIAAILAIVFYVIGRKVEREENFK
jgi:hypothetical protein